MATPNIAGPRASLSVAREYGPIVDLVAAAPVTGDRGARMRLVVDLLWEAFTARGVSWIGFYTKTPGRDEMILGPCRDKPACSPLGLHGVCGQGCVARRPILVADIATLGPNYIACDPRDLSEVVVPLFEPGGACWGVLDADSHERGTFDERDATGLIRVVEAAGLSAAGMAGEPIQR